MLELGFKSRQSGSKGRHNVCFQFSVKPGKRLYIFCRNSANCKYAFVFDILSSFCSSRSIPHAFLPCSMHQNLANMESTQWASGRDGSSWRQEVKGRVRSGNYFPGSLSLVTTGQLQPSVELAGVVK